MYVLWYLLLSTGLLKEVQWGKGFPNLAINICFLAILFCKIIIVCIIKSCKFEASYLSFSDIKL